MRLLYYTLIALFLAGCDRAPLPPSTRPPRAVVEVRPLTPLLPRLATHLAVDSHANVYWNQESDPPLPGGDLTFVMGQGGVPQSIAALQVDHLLATVHLSGHNGAIRSLAVGPDDALYVLFIVSRGPTLVFDVLRYVPSTGRLAIVLDTQHVMDASGLGQSLALAKGSLLGTRSNLWLWVRHTDGNAILKLTQSPDASFQASALSPAPPAEADDLNFNSDDEDMTAAPDGALYYVDRTRGVLWRIAPDEGVTLAMSLTGVPKSITPPAFRKGFLCFLTGVAEKFAITDLPLSHSSSPLAKLEAELPILLEYDGGRHSLRSFDRSQMDAPANLPLRTLQPRQFFWNDSTGSFLVFDAATGEILQLRILGE